MQPAPLTILAGASLGVATASLLSVLRTIRTIPRLPPLERPRDRAWPRISVIVTARDEAATIEAALRAKLADDYPKVEYLVVNDRSSDGTGEIVDRLAAEDDRIVPLHITDLPRGWLGKVHAMHRACALATGEWMLFSDADVHLARGTLQRAVCHCETHALDHLAAFPRIWPSDPLLDATLSTMLKLLVVFGRLWKLSDPESKATIGGGNFNFVRRTMLEKIGGFDDVRLDVMDDVLLGQRIKRAGGRQGAVQAVDAIGLYFYTSVPELARSLEKNAFAANGYSVPRAILSTVAFLAIELGPFVALGLGTDAAAVLGATSIALALGASVLLSQWLERPMLAAVLAPIGGVLFAALGARASFVTRWRGQVVWRETRYSLDELRRGARFELPF